MELEAVVLAARRRNAKAWISKLAARMATAWPSREWMPRASITSSSVGTSRTSLISAVPSSCADTPPRVMDPVSVSLRVAFPRTGRRASTTSRVHCVTIVRVIENRPKAKAEPAAKVVRTSPNAGCRHERSSNRRRVVWAVRAKSSQMTKRRERTVAGSLSQFAHTSD